MKRLTVFVFVVAAVLIANRAAAQTYDDNSSSPALMFMSPDTTTRGSSSIIMTFAGQGWDATTEVRVIFDGIDLGPSFGAGTVLPPTVRNILVPASVLTRAGEFEVELLVKMPDGSYATTNALTFTVIDRAQRRRAVREF